MEFIQLPVEILLHIADSLALERDISSLGRTSQYLHSILTEALYERHRECGNGEILHWAARNDSLETIHRAAEAGIFIHPRNHHLLIAAVKYGHARIVKYLLENHDFDVEQEDVYSYTAFSYCQWDSEKHREVARILIDYGADPSRPTRDCAPICAAVNFGSYEDVALLLEAGADPDGHRGGTTALENAVSDIKGPDIVPLLLNYGAQTEFIEDRTALSLSIEYKGVDHEITQMLVNSGARLRPDNYLLVKAVEVNNVYLVAKLLEYGSDPNARCLGDHEGPLCFAAYRCDVDMVRLLLENGAEITGQDKEGQPLLHLALQHGKWDNARLLVQSGANVNLIDNHGWSLLHACRNDLPLDLAALLVMKGTETNRINGINGQTPMSGFALGKETGIVRLLLDSGADVNDKTSGIPIIVLAATAGVSDTVRLLLERGADISAVGTNHMNAIHAAAKSSSLETVRALVESGGANVAAKTRDFHKSTALHLAAQKGYVEIIEYLCENGADITALDQHGRTPLSGAVEGGHFEATEMLIEWGSNIEASDNCGCTLLWFAQLGKNPNISRLLLERGIDVNRRCKKEYTPLYAALHHGYIDTARLFLGYGADVGQVGENGQTPFKLAVKAKNLEAMKLLKI